MNGQRTSAVTMNPGSTTPATNGPGIVTPKITGSNGRPIRNAPSSQPMYQSGCAGALTEEGLNGPYSQIGLICTRPPIRTTTAAVRKNSPVERNAWPGQNGSP